MTNLPTKWDVLQWAGERTEEDPVDLAQRAWVWLLAPTVMVNGKPPVEISDLPTPEQVAEKIEPEPDTEPESEPQAEPVPRSLWAELSRARRTTMEAIAAICDAGDGWCRTPDLRQHLNIKSGTLSVRLADLSNLGLIERRGRKYRPFEENATDPDEEDPEPVPAHDPPRGTSLRRFSDHKRLAPETVKPLPADHEAVIEARTLFPSTVVDAADSPRLLVSGHNSRKTGAKVTKGPWAGMPIFTLTLEERATCPRDCHMWGACYGNGMPMARRHRHGTEFEQKLSRELNGLQQAHPEGFVVRLHILGDFYSVGYVGLWYAWLKRFPALHVFGYTAWHLDSDIGRAIHRIREDNWTRFAIRISNENPVACGATTLWTVPGKPRDGNVVVCPAQTGATECCGTCGLCWHPAAKHLTIGFVAHGQPFLEQTPKRKQETPAPAPAPTPRKTPVFRPKPSERPPRQPEDVAFPEWLKKPVEWLSRERCQTVIPVDGKPGMFIILGLPGQFTARQLLTKINDFRVSAKLSRFYAPPVDPEASRGLVSSVTTAMEQAS